MAANPNANPPADKADATETKGATFKRSNAKLCPGSHLVHKW